MGKFDATPAETRLKLEPPASREGNGEEDCDKEAVEDLLRFWVSDCTIGNVTRDSIVSEHS